MTAHTTRAQPDGDVPLAPSRRHVLYEAVATLGAAVARLARAYEADPERCRDLQQDIHAEVWHSLARFDGRCSLRTWVYRVAHNVACTHVARARRRPDAVLVGLDELAEMPADGDGDATDRRLDMSRLLALIHRLPPAGSPVHPPPPRGHGRRGHCRGHRSFARECAHEAPPPQEDPR